MHLNRPTIVTPSPLVGKTNKVKLLTRNEYCQKASNEYIQQNKLCVQMYFPEHRHYHL